MDEKEEECIYRDFFRFVWLFFFFSGETDRFFFVFFFVNLYIRSRVSLKCCFEPEHFGLLVWLQSS